MSSRRLHRTRLDLEALEPRWAPATRLSATQLTYQDIDGDNVTVTISKPILTSDAVANTFFGFSGGNGVNGSNATPQQLMRIDLRGSGAAAATGTNIAVEAVANGGNGVAHVGFITAEFRDLGKVKIDGDLGRIVAGDSVLKTPAVKALVVGSMGVQGLATQGGVGDLHTVITGNAGKIVVAGRILDADISVSFVTSDAILKGNIGLLDIGGSLIGSSAIRSGSVVAGGTIGEVHVGGSVLGGAGAASGQIFATKKFGDITILGSLQGTTGQDTGSVRTNGKIGAVSIGGSIVGGNSGGSPSGQLASNAGKIKSLVVDGDIIGAAGFRSGSVDARLGLGSLTINGSLLGSTGQFSGRVDSGNGSIGDVFIGGIIKSGTGDQSGSIAARDNLGHVLVQGIVLGTSSRHVVISAGGVESDGPARIGSLTVNGSVTFADILSGYNASFPNNMVRTNADARIGRVTVGGWGASSLVAGVDRGADGLFGTADDGTARTGSDSFISKIGAITIAGGAQGSAIAGDSFGIVAELVKALSINGVAEALNDGPLNDQNVPLGITADFVLDELEA